LGAVSICCDGRSRLLFLIARELDSRDTRRLTDRLLPHDTRLNSKWFDPFLALTRRSLIHFLSTGFTDDSLSLSLSLSFVHFRCDDLPLPSEAVENADICRKSNRRRHYEIVMGLRSLIFRCFLALYRYSHVVPESTVDLRLIS
jgi:hypothetical protein